MSCYVLTVFISDTHHNDIYCLVSLLMYVLCVVAYDKENINQQADIGIPITRLLTNDNQVPRVSLTHLPLDKMAAIVADDNFKCMFVNENNKIPIRISLKFVPRSPIDSKPALVRVMAWRRIGEKPLPEPVWTHTTDAYMRHYGEMSLLIGIP